jgi:hypothetical protein
MNVWNLVFNLAFNNGTVRCVEVVKDEQGGYRQSLGTSNDLLAATKLPKFTEVLSTLGVYRTSSSITGLADYNFRLTAMTADGSSLGSTEDLGVNTVIDTSVLNSLLIDVELVNAIMKDRVGMLTNANYFDYRNGNDASEVYNLIKGIQSFGNVVSLHSNIDNDAMLQASTGAMAFIIPEMETGALTPALTTAARGTIYDYVYNGGKLICFHAIDEMCDFLNSVFGWSLTSAGLVWSVNIGDDAAGTGFAGAPASLAANDSTKAWSADSLPVGMKKIYVDSNADAVVIMQQVGTGYVIAMGWDWFEAVPVGANDGGWMDVLNKAINVI